MILKDICDDPDSDFCWNRQQDEKISVFNAHVSPFWDYAGNIGFEPAMLEIALNSDDWRKHLERCMVTIRGLIETLPPLAICLVCDDFGTARGSIMSSRTFEQSYLPLMADFHAECMRHKIISAWHSCGDVQDLLEPINASGVSVLWLDEMHLMDASRVRQALTSNQTLWFHPRTAQDLITSQPAWAIYNITASELRGNVEDQKAEFRRIVKEAQDGCQRQ